MPWCLKLNESDPNSEDCSAFKASKSGKHLGSARKLTESDYSPCTTSHHLASLEEDKEKSSIKTALAFKVE